MVSGWNGRLYFVFLPSNNAQGRANVLRTVTELEIPIIDIQREVIDPHPDPLSLYPFRRDVSHYNAEGYRLVAEAISKKLKADGITPLNSRN